MTMRLSALVIGCVFFMVHVVNGTGLLTEQQQAPAASKTPMVDVPVSMEQPLPSAPSQESLAPSDVRAPGYTPQRRLTPAQPSRFTKILQAFNEIPSTLLLYMIMGLLHGSINNFFSAGSPNHNFWWAPTIESVTHLAFWIWSSSLPMTPSGILDPQDAYKWAWLSLGYGCAQMLGESMPRVPYTILPAPTLAEPWRNFALNRSLAMVPIHILRAA